MKKLLPVLLCVLLLLPVFATLRADSMYSPVLTVGSVFAASGEQIAVPLYIQNNPGIAAAAFSIKYDTSKLSLLSAESGPVLSNAIFVPGDPSVMPFSMAFASAGNLTENGVLITFTFTVLPTTCAGEYDILLSFSDDSFFRFDGDRVFFRKTGGKVVVTGDAAIPLTPDITLVYPAENWADEDAFQTVSLDCFTKKNSFDAATYSDVPADAWYYDDVSSAYEYGLMLGMGGGIFDPDGDVAVSEGITMASRIYDISRGGAGEMVAEPGDLNWYDPYVRFATRKGLMKKDQFDSFTRGITRAEMAVLFSLALPDSAYPAINRVEYLPDCSPFDPETPHVLKLYGAGVLTGNDQFGTFFPQERIKRSEAAAIINRVARPDARRSFVLTDSGKDWFALEEE